MTETVSMPIQRMADSVPLSPLDFNTPDPDRVAHRASGARCSLTPPLSLPSRQRAAAARGEAGDEGRPEKLRVNTGSTGSPDDPRDMLCMCTPAPKIPRPRNAFILYRQHHQAQVTAQNPKLSNPDISKIIGVQWKNESSDIKETWKKLADEEKQRHQKQYPEYRYQPRRGSRSLSSRSGLSSTDDYERCAKCNGRLLATPQTPPTPMDTPISRHASEISSPASHRASELRNTRRQTLDCGIFKKLPSAISGRKNRSPDEFEPVSPESKRRRANGAGNYHQANGMFGSYGGRLPREPGRIFSEGTPLNPARQYVSSPLAEFGSTPRSWSGPMAPPPRPSPYSPWIDQRRLGMLNTYDESLRLPPLQTPVSPSPARFAVNSPHPEIAMTGLGISVSPETPARSPESVIMSLSFKRKLGVLARICRPAPPAQDGGTRGAFIAVEGPDEKLLVDVGNAVEKGLKAMNDVNLKIFGNEASEVKREVDAGGRSAGQRFSSYFQAILQWQERSTDITDHMAGVEVHPGKDRDGADQGEMGCVGPGMTIGNESPSAYRTHAIPVALVKEGFSLTHSDKFACDTPITDMYAPADHWQWVASLWRGTVCPDLIVYAKPCSTEEINKLGPVDFSKRMGLILVRVFPGRSLDEGMERRIAFEVMEWMREGSFREEVPKHWRME